MINTQKSALHVTKIHRLTTVSYGCFETMLSRRFRARTSLSSLSSCRHWLASTTSVTTKHTTSRISQHMAKPTVGALIALNDLIRYHSSHADYGLGSPLIDPDLPVGHDGFALFTDSDNSSNPEIQNRRRAQHGNLMGYRHSQTAIDLTGGRASEITPIISNSKVLSIAFATPHIGESHGGQGSGENEVYAMAIMANAISDALYQYCTSHTSLRSSEVH